MANKIMRKIFISYRRDDSSAETGRIYDRLIGHFGKTNIFKDVDDIPAGSDFRDSIQNAINQCSVLIIIIGKDWLSSIDSQGNRRIDQNQDFVRLEIELAFSKNLHIIPVTLSNVTMPKETELPSTIAALCYRQSISIRNDPDFNRDILKLISSIENLIETPTRRLSTNKNKAIILNDKLDNIGKISSPNLFRSIDVQAYVLTIVALLSNLFLCKLNFENIEIRGILIPFYLVISIGYLYGKNLGTISGFIIFSPNIMGHILGFFLQDSTRLIFKGDWAAGWLSADFWSLRTYLLSYPIFGFLGYATAVAKEKILSKDNFSQKILEGKQNYSISFWLYFPLALIIGLSLNWSDMLRISLPLLFFVFPAFIAANIGLRRSVLFCIFLTPLFLIRFNFGAFKIGYYLTETEFIAFALLLITVGNHGWPSNKVKSNLSFIFIFPPILLLMLLSNITLMYPNFWINFSGFLFPVFLTIGFLYGQRTGFLLAVIWGFFNIFQLSLSPKLHWEISKIFILVAAWAGYFCGTGLLNFINFRKQAFYLTTAIFLFLLIDDAVAYIEKGFLSLYLGYIENILSILILSKFVSKLSHEN